MKREFKFIENYKGYEISFVPMTKEKSLDYYGKVFKGQFHADSKSYGLVGFGFVSTTLNKVKKLIDNA
jgi:hypothetical protein